MVVPDEKEGVQVGSPRLRRRKAEPTFAFRQGSLLLLPERDLTDDSAIGSTNAVHDAHESHGVAGQLDFSRPRFIG
jgi:hypothetical protein